MGFFHSGTESSNTLQLKNNQEKEKISEYTQNTLEIEKPPTNKQTNKQHSTNSQKTPELSKHKGQ